MHTVRYFALVLLIIAALSSCSIRTQQSISQEVQAAAGLPIEVCGIDAFAWTIQNALARSAQPPDRAWKCLKELGFTTIIRQNIERDQGEQSAVEQAGMQFVGDYAIPDQTAYSPQMLQAMLQDIVTRLQQGELILVHDAGGRGRMGFWEAAFLMWDGWSSQEAIDRSIAFGWKIDCSKGGNGQMQAINEIARALRQPTYYPEQDSYGTPWKRCPRPAYMDGWDYRLIGWPEQAGSRWSINGLSEKES